MKYNILIFFAIMALAVWVGRAKKGPQVEIHSAHGVVTEAK